MNQSKLKNLCSQHVLSPQLSNPKLTIRSRPRHHQSNERTSLSHLPVSAHPRATLATHAIVHLHSIVFPNPRVAHLHRIPQHRFPKIRQELHLSDCTTMMKEYSFPQGQTTLCALIPTPPCKTHDCLSKLESHHLQAANQIWYDTTTHQSHLLSNAKPFPPECLPTSPRKLAFRKSIHPSMIAESNPQTKLAISNLHAKPVLPTLSRSFSPIEFEGPLSLLESS